MFMSNFRVRDPLRPSFFELYAQQQLFPMLKPALHYAFSVLAMRSRSWEVIANYTDEVFAAMQLVIERHYLTFYDGSFAESFYGLRRTSATALDPAMTRLEGSAPPGLSRRTINMSLFLMVVVPYLKGKADAWYKETRDLEQNAFAEVDLDAAATAALAAAGNPRGRGGGGDPAVQQQQLGARLVGWIKRAYPYFHALYEGSSFVYMLLYLHDSAQYFHWSYHLQQLLVRRMPLQYMMALQQRRDVTRAQTMSKYSKPGLINFVIRLLLRTSYATLDYSHILLPLGIFFFKFLEWWYSENKLAPQSRPVPRPPRAAPRAASGVTLPADRTKCPLCGDTRVNPALLPASGYAFCYPCIHNHVEQHGCCPVTLAPASVDTIRKLYES